MQKKSLTLTAVALLIGLVVASHPTAQGQDKKPCPQCPGTQDHKTCPQCPETAVSKTTTPIACNPAALTPAQRKDHDTVIKQLRAAVQEVKELPDGYAFRYTADADHLKKAAEFISLESRCCAFFNFTLEVAHSGGPMWLRVTGPKEAKPFIKAALTS